MNGDRENGVNDRDASLQLSISSIPDSSYDADTFPIRVMFENRGDEPVSILDAFEPLPVFFSFHLTKSDGTPIPVPGGGKTDFGPQKPDRVKVAPGETFDLTVNLRSLITGPLPPGQYSVSATYHNQYGEDCFTGRLESNSIKIEVS